ncbi:MAG: hypothetical protein MK008_04165 [Bdellovibrionales bacterium]|nr:hypothetical protein [Bdellovibrionales bacterium]
MTQIKIMFLILTMLFSFNVQAANPLSCGMAVGTAGLAAYSSKRKSDLNFRKKMFIEKLKKVNLPKVRAYRVVKLIDKLSKGVNSASNITLMYGGIAAFNGSICAISASRAEAATILDDPLNALETNEDFQALASVVGADKAIISMERIADGEESERVLDSLMPEIEKVMNQIR